MYVYIYKSLKREREMYIYIYTSLKREREIIGIHEPDKLY